MTTMVDESVTAEERTGTQVDEADGVSIQRALPTGRSRVAAPDPEPVVLAAEPAAAVAGDEETADATDSADDAITADENVSAAADLDIDADPADESEHAEAVDDGELDEEASADDTDVAALGEEAPDDDYAESAPADAEPAAESTGGRFRLSRKRRLPARASGPDDRTEAETAGADDDFVPSRRGRGGYDPQADAVLRAARYEHRQRAALGLLLSSLLLGAGGVVFTPMLWSACGLSVLALVVYMVHLRRQVRIEAEIRRRRVARLNRNRRFDETDAEARDRRREPLDPDSARALRRRAVVLDTDDEDPVFEQLEPFAAATARAVRNRAAGREVRRAAGE